VNSGLSAQKYGNDWYAAGGVPPGTFKNSVKKVDQVEASVIKSRLVTAIRTREPIVYGSDWDYNPLTIAPEQAQMIESLKLSASQIAAVYGIAPEEVGGEASNSLTYANEEMRQTTRLHNLRPWMSRLETGFSALLPDVEYVKFAADATIRADISTRWSVYEIQRRMGYRNLDEIRALEDEAPLPDGQGLTYGEGESTALDEARGLAEVIQKLYLGTPDKVVITQDEAREILNRAGAGLTAADANSVLRNFPAPGKPVPMWTYPG
jgi:HK97 family phage portal protein